MSAPIPSSQPGLSSRARAPGSQRLSKVLAAACLVIAVLLPALVVYYLCVSTPQVLAAKLGVSAALHSDAPRQISVWRNALVVVIATVPVVLIAYGFLRARTCFQAFARAEYFSLAAVSGLRGFAGGTFLSGVAGLLVAPLSSLALTLGTGAGRSALTLGVGSNELLLILFAAMVWQIASALGQAAQLAEENAQFV